LALINYNRAVMRILTLLLLLTSFNAFSQWKEYIIGVKGDTLNCVDKKGLKQGRWVVHVDNARGERGYEEEGVYENGKKEGMWRRFSLEGDLIAVENYRWGQKNGKSVYLNQMGNPIREESWKAVNPENPYDTVDVYDVDDPTRVVEKRVVKLEGATLKHGTWKFYDQFSGKVEKKEEYVFDKLKTKGDDDDLAPIAITDGSGNSNATSKANAATSNDEEEVDNKKKLPKPQAVLDYEKKNAGKKKIRVRDGNTGY
jgi:antitoxin component YwqK of YwqJK toxin-antitoxin module